MSEKDPIELAIDEVLMATDDVIEDRLELIREKDNPKFIDQSKVFAGIHPALEKGTFISLRIVPIKDLIATQEYIGTDKAKAIAEKFNERKSSIEIIQEDGKLYVYDGHHTIVAAFLIDRESVNAKVFTAYK